MGFLGGGQDTSETEELLNQQNEEAKAELEQKKQSLYQTRLDLIKSQGGQSWTPNYSPRTQQSSGNPGLDLLRQGLGNVKSGIQSYIGKGKL